VLARLHSLLGAVPLCAFVLLHACGQRSALAGREAWVDDAVHHSLSGTLFALVVLSFLAHALLGVLRVRREPYVTGDLRGAATLRSLQLASGVLAFGFVLYHVVTLGVFDSGPHTGVRAPYARLWSGLGRPYELAIYLFGMAAVCLHLGHGLSRAAVTWRLARSAQALLVWRVAAGAVGLAVFCLLLQIVAHFAIGASLLAR
jgi:succinate dehydrogenase / fumarate reductase cytochrome b subunit